MKLLKDLGMEYPTPHSKQKQRYGIYECPKCKAEVRTQHRYVKTGRSTQCKTCGQVSRGNLKHGLENHELYGRWQAMKQRCYNPNNRDYYKYGGKGITICDEWRNNFRAYYDWCMEHGYSQELFLDKDIKSNELGITPPMYSPETCQFVSMKRNSQEASGVKVIQKDINGNILAEFNSFTEAARHLEKATRKQIKKCCDGIVETVGGFIWEKKPT